MKAGLNDFPSGMYLSEKIEFIGAEHPTDEHALVVFLNEGAAVGWQFKNPEWRVLYRVGTIELNGPLVPVPRTSYIFEPIRMTTPNVETKTPLTEKSQIQWDRHEPEES